jgi:putative DNA primase/helicase
VKNFTVIEFAHYEVDRYISHRDLKGRPYGKEFRGPCPVHHGKDYNFSMNLETGEWFCHSHCDRGGSLIGLEMEISSASFAKARDEVFRIVGRPAANGHHGPEEVEHYDYTDENGKLLFQFVRFFPKTFKQRRPDGAGGHIWDLHGVRRVPYHLPKLKSAQLILIVEGEKDVHALERLGLTATTNPMGAEKWRDEYTDMLIAQAPKAEFVIFPDEDEPGRRHAERVSQSFRSRGRSVAVAKVAIGKDISDWIAAGATRATIEGAIQAAIAAAVQAGVSSSQNSLPIAVDPTTSKFHRSQGGLLLGYSAGDVGNAERFLQCYRQDVRYCIDQDGWVCFDGRRWKCKGDKEVRRFSHEVLKRMAHEAIDYNGPDSEAYRSLTKHFHQSSRISSALCEAIPHVQVMSNEFDGQTHLLNFQNGTVDLTTGKLRPHRREDMLTRVLDWNYEPEAMCPIFDSFLHHAMGGTPDASEGQLDRADRLSDYVISLLGYSVSGETREKAVILCVGPKDTSKTTLLVLLVRLLGDYASMIQVESLMSKHDSQIIQQDLWSLCGRRFVMTSETGKDQSLAVARLKRITQGQGFIKVIPKYMTEVTFPETHKLWVDCNYPPTVHRGDDIWERLYRIPFKVVITKDQQDKTLLSQMLAEAPGILAKLVAACSRWYREGLPTIPEITAVREQWRSESHPLRAFLDERCEVDPARDDYVCKRSTLYKAYQDWACENGERQPLSSQEFLEEVEKLGCKSGKPKIDGKQQRGFWGIRLRSTDPFDLDSD